jgi:nucleotide-binding universal stress UspA family protein
MAMYRSILVPLDGSSFGEHALPLALSIACRAEAHLHLAHVHQASRLASDTAAEQEQRADEGAYLDGLLRRLQASCDLPITTKLLDGPIAQALRDYAVEIQADLIVMTTHGRGALSRAWLGSIADALMRSVSMPVLLVRPHEQPADIAREPAIHHILVPLDGSALAEQILGHATELGRITHAEYTLLQVTEPVFVGYGSEMSAISANEQILESLQTQAQAYLDRVAAGLRAEGLQVQTITMIEFAAAAILEYAREHAVDLIALETQGRGGLARWIVGGVADKVIRGASVPVLLHRPQGGGAWAP